MSNPVRGITSEKDARAYLQQRGIQALQHMAGYIAPVGEGFSDRFLEKRLNYKGVPCLIIHSDMCFECAYYLDRWLKANKIRYVHVKSKHLKYMEQCLYCDFVEDIPF